MSRTLFRSFIIFSLVLFGISIAIEFFPPNLPPELLNYKLSRHGVEPRVIDFVYFISFIIATISFITLLFFKSWARLTFTVSVTITYLCMFFYGPQVSSAIQGTLYSISSVIDGLIIALIYFSPISEEFGKSKKRSINYKRVIAFFIIGILLVLLGIKLVRVAPELIEKIVEQSGTVDEIVVQEEVINASDVLLKLGVEKDVEQAKISDRKQSLETSLLERIKKYRVEQNNLQEKESITQWLALLELAFKVEQEADVETYENIDNYTGMPVGVRSVILSMPDAATWPLFKGVNLTDNEDSIQTLSSEYLIYNLVSDKKSIDKVLVEIENSINTLDGKGKSNALRSLYKIQSAHVLAGSGPHNILDTLNKRLLISRDRIEEIDIPNLVKIVGAEKTREWLQHALSTDKIVLEILDGTETYSLAQDVVLALEDELKEPQWKLAQDLNSIELYEKMYERFSVPDDKDYDLRRDYEDAFSYYFISHVVKNDVNKSLEIIKNSYLKKSLNITKDILFKLEKNGYSEQVWNVLNALLDEDPLLPLWSSYFKVSAYLDKTDAALNKIANLLKEGSFSGKRKATIQSYYINGLLSVGDTEAAFPLLHENVESLSGKRQEKAATQLVKLAHLLGNDAEFKFAMEYVVKGLKLNKKNKMIMDYFDHSSKGKIEFLRELEYYAPAQQYLIQEIDAQISKANESYDEYGSFYAYNLKSYVIELLGIYYDLEQWQDIKIFLDKFPYWGEVELSSLVIEEDSRDMPFGMIAAKALVETGDIDSANKVLEKLLRKKSGYDPAYQLYLDINNEKAIQYFDSVYKLDQFEERPLIWKAQAYFNSGNYSEAKKIIKQAIAIDPSDGEQGVGDRMRAYSILADVLEKEGDVESTDLYRSAVKAIRLSENADRYHNLKLYSQAIEKYREASRIFTGAYCIQSRLAIQLTKQGQHKEASKHYKRAFELMPDSFGRIESHCFGCESIFDHPNAQTIAEDVFKEIIINRPDNAQAHYMLAYLRKEQNRYDEAIDSFRKAVALDPEYLNSWKQLYKIGQKSYLPGWENDIALLKMFELDPLERHTYLDFDSVTDIKGLWQAANKAFMLGQTSNSSIYPLAASKNFISGSDEATGFSEEKMSMYSYMQNDDPAPPAVVLMETDIISGAAELMMKPENIGMYYY